MMIRIASFTWHLQGRHYDAPSGRVYVSGLITVSFKSGGMA